MKNNFLGFNIQINPLSKIIFKNKTTVINTINPHSYCVAKKDKNFEKALKSSDILLPDGIGIVWAEKFLNGRKIKKIAGYDLFVFLMNKLQIENGSVFFLGASEETLYKIKEKCKLQYPNIIFNCYSPPFIERFTKEDSMEMCKKVNLITPNVLFVGMTAPKQEKWVHEFRGNLDADIICSIGAVFDFYAGNIKRSSNFWIYLGLEWLPRLVKEPKRLFYRNFISTPKFIFEIIKMKFF